MEKARNVGVVRGVCLPAAMLPAGTVPLTLVLTFLVVMALLGADPALVLGSVAVVAGAAARLVRG
jgi:hypothetical protein